MQCKIKIAFQIFLWIAIQDQRSVVLSYDKAWDVFRWKQGIRSVFQRIQKIRTLLLLEKSSDFVVVVRVVIQNFSKTIVVQIVNTHR